LIAPLFIATGFVSACVTTSCAAPDQGTAASSSARLRLLTSLMQPWDQGE